MLLISTFLIILTLLGEFSKVIIVIHKTFATTERYVLDSMICIFPKPVFDF